MDGNHAATVTRYSGSALVILVLLRHFTNSNGDYRIGPAIKNRVEFGRHDLLDDRFEGGFDLIICRNVVIYFTNEARKGLDSRFAGALTNDGVLFIGATEILLNARELGLNTLRTGFYQKTPSTVSVRG